MSGRGDEYAELRCLRRQRLEIEVDYLYAAGWEPAPRGGWWRERNPDRSIGRTAPMRHAVALVDRDLDEDGR